MIEMSRSESLELLDHCLIGRLSMVDANGQPYVLPMRYVWHQGAIYVRLAYAGRKQEALDHARRVCFEADELETDFSHYASVLIEGTLLDITDEAEKMSALVALNEKYARLSGIPSPGPQPVTRGVAIRKVVVEILSGRKREPDPAPAKNRLGVVRKAHAR